MYNVEFDESLVTGNEMIDEQHKELIGKIQDLLRSCEKGSEKATAVKTVSYTHLDVYKRQDKETLGGSANEKFVYLLQNIPYKKERAGLSTGVMKKET